MAVNHSTKGSEPTPKLPENHGTGGRSIATTFAIALLALLVTIALALQWPPVRDRLLSASIDLANDRIVGELAVAGFEGHFLGGSRFLT